MSECYVSLGPLCWVEPWKFYFWLVSQVLIWGGVIAFNVWLWRRK